jgi:NADH-quinone oxidoreductase subunit N
MFTVIGSTTEEYPLVMQTTIWGLFFACVSTAILVLHCSVEHATMLCNLFLIDFFGSTMKAIVLLLGALVCVLSETYVDKEKIYSFEYFLLMGYALWAMMFLISSNDLLALYVSLELQSLSLYVLAASNRTSVFSTEAGLKYFCLGALASGLFLFGCVCVYGATGTTHFHDIFLLVSGGMNNSELLYVGLLSLTSAFFFKLSAAPFHMWSPDVYEGAPTYVTLFFALAPKVTMLSVVLRLFFTSFFDMFFVWNTMAFFCASLSLLVGSFGALSQKKMKRLVAFSSISHVGFLLAGISCGTVDGVAAVLVYILLYCIMSAVLFGVILSLSGDSGRITYIYDLSGLGANNLVLSMTIAAVFFSMSGIPPLAGFFGKLVVLSSCVGSNLYFLVFLGVTTSCVSCFYYIRIVKIMFFEDKKVGSYIQYGNEFSDSLTGSAFVYPTADQRQVMTYRSAVCLGLGVSVLLFYCIYPGPLLVLCHSMALSLCS